MANKLSWPPFGQTNFTFVLFLLPNFCSSDFFSFFKRCETIRQKMKNQKTKKTKKQNDKFGRMMILAQTTKKKQSGWTKQSIVIDYCRIMNLWIEKSKIFFGWKKPNFRVKQIKQVCVGCCRCNVNNTRKQNKQKKCQKYDDFQWNDFSKQEDKEIVTLNHI